MNPLSLLPDSESEVSLFYLVPFSQIYLYQVRGDPLYLYLAVIGFISTVTVHTLLRAIFGPDLEDTPSSNAIKKRLMTAVYVHRQPWKQPDTYGDLIEEIDLTVKFLARILIYVILISPFFIIQFYSLYLYLTAFPSLELVGQLTAFGLAFPFVEGLVGQLWTNAYQYEDEFPTTDEQTLQIVRGFVKTSFTEDMESEKLEYELSKGGRFKIQYSTESSTEEDLEEEVHRIAFGYLSIVNQLPYPTSMLYANFQGADEKEGEFYVKANWVKMLNGGQISETKFIERVDATIQISEEI